MRIKRFYRVSAFAVLCWFAGMVISAPAFARDEAFHRWLEALWPQAHMAGISRATFDEATRDLEPDLSLPDLIIPGRPEKPDTQQAEFIKSPAEYLSVPTLARLAAQGRKLFDEHRATLAAIERTFGVPGTLVLAVWGRETDYGHERQGHNAFQVLATQAFLGRRKDQFLLEFVLALKMVEEGQAKFSDMRSSWAGAMGMTQFLPSEFYKYAVDFDGDGRRDIWASVPDALASAAKQLADKGWQSGKGWAYEVRLPVNLDCTQADPERKMPVAEWIKRGFALAYGRTLTPQQLAEPASLLLPAGIYGPGFLILDNYYVIKSYNFSDLYVLFVGHLSDRINDARPFEAPWGKVKQLTTIDVALMQRQMTVQGYYRDTIDGKAGMKTRLALGAYQKANGLKLDCWPTAAVLDRMRGGGTK